MEFWPLPCLVLCAAAGTDADVHFNISGSLSRLVRYNIFPPLGRPANSAKGEERPSNRLVPRQTRQTTRVMPPTTERSGGSGRQTAQPWQRQWQWPSTITARGLLFLLLPLPLHRRPTCRPMPPSQSALRCTRDSLTLVVMHPTFASSSPLHHQGMTRYVSSANRWAQDDMVREAPF